VAMNLFFSFLYSQVNKVYTEFVPVLVLFICDLALIGMLMPSFPPLSVLKFSFTRGAHLHWAEYFMVSFRCLLSVLRLVDSFPVCTKDLLLLPAQESTEERRVILRY
jgi:hypothetical protein